ncbi:hypothetical protein ACU01Y_004103 [Salmonella enterica subsp. enterica serovar Newport]
MKSLRVPRYLIRTPYNGVLASQTRHDYCPRYLIRTPYNGVLASQTRHDYCPQSTMIRGVMSPGLVGRW